MRKFIYQEIEDHYLLIILSLILAFITQNSPVFELLNSLFYNMKIKIITFLILTSVTLSFTSCKKSYIVSDKQQILFQVDYINYAWGYQHNGFIIDEMCFLW